MDKKTGISHIVSVPYGGCSSVGRALGCGPSCRGFESHQSPHFQAPILMTPDNAAPTIENAPSIGWGAMLAPKGEDSHKYTHGHVVCLGGKRLTGAGCLAAIAALRMGAGLVTVAAHPEVVNVYRGFCPSLMVEPCEEVARFKEHVRDVRRTVAIVGPGAGQENAPAIRKAVLDCVQMEPLKTCVLDADALTSFAEDPRVLLNVTGPHCVLTPHEGEFDLLFPFIDGDKVERAQQAALKSRAIVVLKGAETVIASPEGGCVVNRHGTGWLATAGTGDVLAGMIAGLAARNLEGLSLFGAVCASVWMHGEIGQRLGAGMISADMPGLIPALWKDLLAEAERLEKARPTARDVVRKVKLPSKKAAGKRKTA